MKGNNTKGIKVKKGRVTLSKEGNYGNWVPASMMKTMLAVDVLLLAAAGIFAGVLRLPAVGVVIGILCAVMCIFTFYMWRCRVAFDFNKGGVMGDVHQFLVEHLPWDGNGTLLDIGCGAGALTLRCAKRFPAAKLIGMDFWGKEWSYAKEQCEKNAAVEGVGDRVHFQKGDAAKLDFGDGAFDAVVSNFVFHEVRSADNKLDVVRESLRVLKKGGAFSLQDMFAQKALYGDMERFVEELTAAGFQEVHYIPNIENVDGLVPQFIQTPWMVKGAGLLYGIK